MTYLVGQRISVSTQVKDAADVLTDATVVLTVTAPDGTVSTPAVNHPGTGLYNADATLDQAGDWLYVWSATGAVVTTESGQWHVVAASLLIVGLSEVKDHGNITGTASDRELLGFIGTAQQMIEDKVGSVVPTTVTDERHTAGRTRVWLNRSPVVSVTAVTEWSGSTLVGTLLTSEFYLDPESGTLSRLTTGGTSSYYLGTELRVTYVAGRRPIPEAIRWAAKELTIHLWRSTQALRGGRARGAAADDVVAAGAGYGLPNRVEDALAPFKKPPAVY